MTTTQSAPTDSRAAQILSRLGVDQHPLFVPPAEIPAGGAGIAVTVNPATDAPLGAVRLQSRADYDDTVERARAAFRQWRMLPAPQRGEIVRRIGEKFRQRKADLGALVTLEMGKILTEGEGEVQECIDIADFAVGLSRQLYGLTMPSERPAHRMFEQWHPLGAIGVITAFNFPVAVWAWNAMIASVCGDSTIWKPSLATPLTAIGATRIAHDVMQEQDLFRPGGIDPRDVFPLIIGADDEVGEAMTADRRLPLISATGSCRMGRIVGEKVAARLGKCLLELGGNNAIILMPDADMDMAARAVVFGSVGTAGQRCTSTRRLLCVGGSADAILPKILGAYETVRIGDPMDRSTLMGPLISKDSVAGMGDAVRQAQAEGCEVLAGGLPGIERFSDQPGSFVEPTIIKVPKGKIPAITLEETFAPVLYVFEVDSIDEAIDMHNDVAQGLSSAVFTDSVRSAGRFLSHAGSDCGIANVNLGTSGAEIGGAFGGEKDTGGGRESGSDAWKSYMRRQTCTINNGDELPLAQGVEFA